MKVCVDMNKLGWKLKYVVVWDPIDLERPWSFRTCRADWSVFLAGSYHLEPRITN